MRSIDTKTPVITGRRRDTSSGERDHVLCLPDMARKCFGLAIDHIEILDTLEPGDFGCRVCHRGRSARRWSAACIVAEMIAQLTFIYTQKSSCAEDLVVMPIKSSHPIVDTGRDEI